MRALLVLISFFLGPGLVGAQDEIIKSSPPPDWAMNGIIAAMQDEHPGTRVNAWEQMLYYAVKHEIRDKDVNRIGAEADKIGERFLESGSIPTPEAVYAYALQSLGFTIDDPDTDFVAALASARDYPDITAKDQSAEILKELVPSTSIPLDTLIATVAKFGSNPFLEKTAQPAGLPIWMNSPDSEDLFGELLFSSIRHKNSPEQLAPVANLTSDESPAVRELAVGLLGIAGDIGKHYKAELIDALFDSDTYVKRNARCSVLSLKISLNPPELDKLVSELENGDSEVKVHVARVLRGQPNLENRHLAALGNLLGDQDFEVVLEATEALNVQKVEFNSEHVRSILSHEKRTENNNSAGYSPRIHQFKAIMISGSKVPETLKEIARWLAAGVRTNDDFLYSYKLLRAKKWSFSNDDLEPLINILQSGKSTISQRNAVGKILGALGQTKILENILATNSAEVIDQYFSQLAYRDIQLPATQWNTLRQWLETQNEPKFLRSAAKMIVFSGKQGTPLIEPLIHELRRSAMEQPESTIDEFKKYNQEADEVYDDTIGSALAAIFASADLQTFTSYFDLLETELAIEQVTIAAALAQAAGTVSALAIKLPDLLDDGKKLVSISTRHGLGLVSENLKDEALANIADYLRTKGNPKLYTQMVKLAATHEQLRTKIEDLFSGNGDENFKTKVASQRSSFPFPETGEKPPPPLITADPPSNHSRLKKLVLDNNEELAPVPLPPLIEIPGDDDEEPERTQTGSEPTPLEILSDTNSELADQLRALGTLTRGRNLTSQQQRAVKLLISGKESKLAIKAANLLQQFDVAISPKELRPIVKIVTSRNHNFQEDALLIVKRAGGNASDYGREIKNALGNMDPPNRLRAIEILKVIEQEPPPEQLTFWLDQWANASHPDGDDPTTAFSALWSFAITASCYKDHTLPVKRMQDWLSRQEKETRSTLGTLEYSISKSVSTSRFYREFLKELADQEAFFEEFPSLVGLTNGSGIEDLINGNEEGQNQSRQALVTLATKIPFLLSLGPHKFDKSPADHHLVGDQTTIREIGLGSLTSLMDLALRKPMTLGDCRFLITWLSGGDPGIRAALRVVASPGAGIKKKFTRTEINAALPTLEQIWAFTETRKGKYHALRKQLADAFSEIASKDVWKISDKNGQPTSTDIETLKALAERLKSSEFTSDFDSISSSLASLQKKQHEETAHRKQSTVTNAVWRGVAIHGVLWILFIFFYPRSRMIQAFFFWNPWVRKTFGFPYVLILQTCVPAFRRRLKCVRFLDQ